MQDLSKIIVPSLRLVLKPAMRFCLRYGLKLQEILESCKVVLIEAAAEELQSKGEKITENRLSIMTGVHRPDVVRLYRSPGASERTRANVIARIMGKWQSHRKYTTGGGKPRVLEFSGKEGEFADLTSAVSADLNPYTVLHELERCGAVKHTARGVQLVTPHYVLKDDVEGGFKLLSGDHEDMLLAVEENLLRSPDVPNLHLKTEYDEVSPRFAKQIRNWFLKEGSAFHARARRFLAQYDRSANSRISADEKLIRVAVCTFSRIDEENPRVAHAAEKKEIDEK